MILNELGIDCYHLMFDVSVLIDLLLLVGYIRIILILAFAWLIVCIGIIKQLKYTIEGMKHQFSKSKAISLYEYVILVV